VLVVGETVVGLTLTLLLGRAGYDPVLVGVRDRPWRSRVTYLPPPVRRVFDGIGVGERVRDRSVAVERVAVHGGDADSETGTVLSAAERTAPAPAVVRTRALRSVLEQRVSERRRRPERPIESLSQRDGGVTVRFDDGITERFDVVVDTSGSAALRPGDGAAPERVRLAQFEVPLDDGASRSRLRDRWHPNAVVQYSPRRGDPGTLLRITAPVRAVPSLLSGAEPAESSLADALADALGGPTRWSAGADLRAVTQVRLPRGPIRAAWWGVGAVSFCGRAACPVAPATGLDLALGVEDALAFVRALSERRRAASAAVEAYTTARRRRLTALRQTVATARATGEPPLSRPPTSSLGSLDVFRHAALGPFLGEPLWSLHRSGVR
jgi:2-polyprenyl-6-methoxyphenol hydroxylase-like FAD-dependent oxidoreductase